MNWYFTRDNLDPLMGEGDYDEDILPGVGHISFLAEPTGFNPLDGEEDAVLNEDHQISAIQASEQEKAEWGVAYQKLLDGLGKDDQDLRTAWNAFTRAKERVEQRRTERWAVYAPIQKAIEDRQDAVSRAFEDKAKGVEVLAQEAAQRAQDEEDARLGPRLFYVTRPSQRGIDSREMDVPTVHHIDCGTAKRLRQLPDLVRIEVAFEELMDGGRSAQKRWSTWEVNRDAPLLLPGTACERCKAFELLRSHAPETFDAWLERTESAQRAPMPANTWTGNQQLFKKLGLAQCSNDGSRPGWSRASDKHYRENSGLADDEILIGWVEKKPYGPTVVPGVERLKELFDQLPARGFSVRWVHEPTRFDPEEKVSETSVAIRPMTKWELRQQKESK